MTIPEIKNKSEARGGRAVTHRQIIHSQRVEMKGGGGGGGSGHSLKLWLSFFCLSLAITLVSCSVEKKHKSRQGNEVIRNAH